MKAFARRSGLLLGLILFAGLWVLLMSLDLSAGGGSAVAPDGAEASVPWVDSRSSDFPRVEAHVSVVDQDGQPLQGLRKEDFSLQEDGLPAEILAFLGAGEQSVTTMLVIDHSGSMKGEKIRGALEAANTFAGLVRPEQDQAGVIAFGSRVEQIQPLTGDPSLLKRATDGIRASGGTAFYDAVHTALTDLQSAGGRRIVLALTDGRDNESRYRPEQVIALAQGEGIAIYTIGLGSGLFGADKQTLEEMAEETGGEFHHSPSAAELSALYRRIAKAVQNEYVLGYDSPTPDLDGTTRRVQVSIARGAGDLLARGTYSVSGSISSTLNWDLFLPLFLGLLVLLLGLLSAPSLLARMPKRKPVPVPVSPAASYPPGQYAPPPVVSHPPGPYAHPGQPAPPAPAVSRPPGAYIPPGQLVTPAPPAHISSPQPAPATQSCPHCGAQMRVGARFCPVCGKGTAPAPQLPVHQTPPPGLVVPHPQIPSAPQPKPVCRNCGTSLRLGVAFCGTCGTKAGNGER